MGVKYINPIEILLFVLGGLVGCALGYEIGERAGQRRARGHITPEH